MTTLEPDLAVPDAAKVVKARAFELGVKEGHRRTARAVASAPPAHRPAGGVVPSRAAPASFTAAARLINMGSESEQARIKDARARNQWQDEAWGYFDALPEVKNGARFKGRSLSKLRLYVGIVPEPGAEPVPLDQLSDYPDLPSVPAEVQAQAQDVIDRLGAGRGTEHLLDRWGRNSFVAGEAYLVGYQDETSPSGETFYMASPDELRVSDRGGWALCMDPLDQPKDWITLDPQTSTMVRIWNQHGRYGNLPDSSIRGVLDLCEILLAERNSELGDAMSRANNGILLMPHGMVGFTPPTEDEAPEAGSEALRNPLVRDIYDHILTPIGNPRSPSVAAPFIMTADPDDIEKVRYMSFTTDRGAPAKIVELRQQLAQGVDLPEEILLGFGNATYSNSWIINDQTWTFYLQPDAHQFVQALTLGLFRPLLMAGGTDPTWARRLVVWYDKSQLVGDPDESVNAFKAVELGLIGDTAGRRRMGYSEAEAPTPDDIALRIALRGRGADIPGILPQAEGVTQDPPATPEPAAAAAPAESAPAAATAAVVAAGGPSRRQLDAMARRWAKRDRQLLDRLLAQADTSMTRALDKAGAKLRTKAMRASAAHAEAVQHVANRDVAMFLGPGVVTASLGFEPEDLLAGSFDELGSRFDAQVARAQAATLADLEALGLDPDDVEAMAEQQARDRRTGAALLTASLLGFATKRLFDPSPKAAPLGELDSNLSVPVNYVREAMTRAGGSESGITKGGTARHPVSDRVAMGVTDGDTVAQYLAKLHISTTAWRWVYGDSERSFQPHLDLDGVEFTAWTDPELANTEGWPSDPFYFPGDHVGCQCSTEQVLEQDGTEPPE